MIVILGSTGQVGEELCRSLAERAVGLSHKQLDITNTASVHKTIKQINPRVIINAAAYTDVDAAESNAELCMKTNTEAVKTLADLSNEIDAKLVQLSTDYVFGGDIDRRTPYTETDVVAPQGIYAQSKLEGERFASTCNHHLIVRTSALYARPTQSDAPHRNFVETMTRLGKTKPSVQVIDDQIRSPTYVPDLVRALVHLIEHNHMGIYNITNCDETTWYQFAKEIFKLNKQPMVLSPISARHYLSRAKRPDYSVLDLSKYNQTSGPRMRSWSDALRAYFEVKKKLTQNSPPSGENKPISWSATDTLKKQNFAPM